MKSSKKELTTIRALLPVIVLFLLIIFGVLIIPQILAETKEITDASGVKQIIKEPGPEMPLEVAFIIASIVSVINLFDMRFTWEEIQDSIIKKVTQLIPAALILFSIGLLVGSWVFSGTIPMLIYYGSNLISPNYIYIVAFIVPSIFSLFTGTSWASAGTIGVVIIGIAGAIDANLAITAGAIVGGSYFGDKMSPLSDTTNIASLATGVPLMEHIRSMINTTGPSFILAGLTYTVIGLVANNRAPAGVPDAVENLQSGLKQLFNFDNIFLIIILSLPIIIVLYGAFGRKPTVPTLLASSIIASILGVFIHGFDYNSMLTSLNSGFNTAEFFPNRDVDKDIEELLDRGGLYSMVEPVIISIMVFIFVGTLDTVNTISFLVGKGFNWIKTRPQAIISSLFATGLTNALTSNQFATSYIIAEAFQEKYSKLKIPKKVLSRSLEDYGTMLESLLPWTTTGVFMFGALGISPIEYAGFQFVSLFGFVIAIILAVTGIGCFYNEKEEISSKGEKKNYE